uniref:p35 protein n=1 Tax=Leucania separata nucleopolyhedrovirus TaxID=1307956 RepID=Q9IP70_NPVLS|nr:P35 protein [Leucania separata nucleopolyhedrovirus]
MCVIFPVEVHVSQPIIRDCQVDKQTRELVYINKTTNTQPTKPVLTMFNISGPIRSETRKNKFKRDRIKSKEHEQFDPLQRDWSDQMGGFHHSIKYFRDEHYSVRCQNRSVFKSKFGKILQSHDYADKKCIEAYGKFFLPKFGHRSGFYVALAVSVWKPGLENSSFQVLSFEYNPDCYKVIVPFGHEIGVTGCLDDDVAAKQDSVEEERAKAENRVQSLMPPCCFKNSENLLSWGEASKNKSMWYNPKEFTTECRWPKSQNNNWKIFCNRFIYDKKRKVLYVKLHNVTSALNKNVIFNTIFLM